MVKQINPMLGKYALGYMPSNLIGVNLLPKIAFDAEKIRLPFWTSNQFTMPNSTVRAMRSDTQELEFGDFSYVDITLDEHSFKYKLDNREISNMNLNLGISNGLKIGTTDAMSRLRIAQEKEIADLVTTSTNYASGHYTEITTSTSKWSDYANSTPLADIQLAIDKVYSATGVMPNVMYMSYAIYNKLKWHPDILEIMKTTADKVVTPAFLGGIFGIADVQIGTQTYKTLNGGTNTDIWGNYFGVLIKNAATASTPQPAFGITAEYNNYNDVITTTQTEDGKNTLIIPTLFYKPVKLMDTAGYLYKNCIV